MHLREKLDEESIKSKFESQRPSSYKSGLGFDKEKKPRYSSWTNQDGNKRSYAVVLMSQIKKEESKKFSSPLQRTYMMPKIPVASKHQPLFLGKCYTCNNFGQMARNCKLKTPVEKGITSHTFVYKKNIRRNNLKGRNYNSFAPLQNSTKCYNCGNQGHIARKCKLVIPMVCTSKH